jgi:flagellar biogenesis protein FliO
MDTVPDLVRQSCAIAIVFLLLWLALRWLKSRGYATVQTRLRRPEQPREVELLERLVLTPQHSVQLLRFRQQLLLVGLHPAGFAVLSEAPAAPEPELREMAAR